MTAPARTELEAAAQACFAAITPQSAQVLTAVLERWNGLTITQQRRIFALTEQLARATALKSAGRSLRGPDTSTR